MDNLDLQDRLQPFFQVPTASGKVITILALVSIGLLFAISVFIQISFGLQGSVLARRNLTAQREVSASRGIFYDRNHKKLVRNKQSYSIVVDPQLLSSTDSNRLVIALSQVLNIEKSDLLPQFKAKERFTLSQSLTSDQVIVLDDLVPDLEYQVNISSDREYLYPTQFAHIIGYTGVVSANDISKGYGFTDKVGKYGLEQRREEDLKGLKGREVVYNSVAEYVEPVPGNNVVLTIDLDWQNSLQRILARQVNKLNARAGAAAIMDVQTGEVLAYASAPTFSSNDFASGISQQKLDQYLNNPKKPLVDKVVGLQAPPGSTFKVVTAYANLELGTINENSTIFSTGCMKLGNSQFCEFGKYYLGQLNIISALARSSNTFFCKYSLQLVNKYGYQEYLDKVLSLGIGRVTGIETTGEIPGIFPSPEYKLDTFNQQWYGGDTCNTVIGQGMVLTTPIQMLNMVATIANGGRLLKPTLVKTIEDSEGNVVSQSVPEVIEEVKISNTTRNLILQGMRQAVVADNGTAHSVLGSSGANLRVKTGSAEATEFINGKWRKGVHGWVIGTFDYSGRTYAFVVHVNYGGGGWNATPVVKKFVNCLNTNFRRSCENV